MITGNDNCKCGHKFREHYGQDRICYHKETGINNLVIYCYCRNGEKI